MVNYKKGVLKRNMETYLLWLLYYQIYYMYNDDDDGGGGYGDSRMKWYTCVAKTEVNDTMTMRSKKLIASRSSSLVSTPVNSSIESVHASSYNWPNFSASLVGRLSSFKSAISGLLEVSLDPAILLSLKLIF